MPLIKVRQEGKEGWKFGESGAVYFGPGGRGKARKQGAAIKISQARRRAMNIRKASSRRR
jgi:hypothetical protein